MTGRDWFVVVKGVDGLDLYWDGHGWTSAGQLALIYYRRDAAEEARGQLGGTGVKTWSVSKAYQSTRRG